MADTIVDNGIAVTETFTSANQSSNWLTGEGAFEVSVSRDDMFVYIEAGMTAGSIWLEFTTVDPLTDEEVTARTGDVWTAAQIELTGGSWKIPRQPTASHRLVSSSDFTGSAKSLLSSGSLSNTTS